MSERVLILKVVRDDMTSHNGFKWPESGPVRPEVWEATAECGNGLHGWLAGEGAYRHDFMEGKWLVFSAKKEDVILLDRGDKVKAKEGEVVFCGTRSDAVKYLIEQGALSDKSSPGWCCFSETQLCELAYRSATRAAKKHAVKALRTTKSAQLDELADAIVAMPDVTDSKSAGDMRDKCYAANYAADAANYAAEAAYYAARAANYAADAVNYAADAANYAAEAAYYAADAAGAARAARAANYAAGAANDAASAANDAAYYAAEAAYDAAYYAANAANNAEREEQRKDRLELLGFSVR